MTVGALTRAKQRLYLTCANQRMLFGHTTNNRPSRFTGEIPAELLEQTGRRMTDRSERYFDSDRYFDDDFDQTRPAVSTWREPYSRGERRSSYGGGSGNFSYGGFYGNSSAERRPSTPRPAPAARPAAPRKQAPISARPSSGYTAPSAPAVNLPSFQKGDMVDHKAFGKGMILSVQKMGGDALLEIAFDNVGTKKLMLKAAAQHMKKA